MLRRNLCGAAEMSAEKHSAAVKGEPYPTPLANPVWRGYEESLRQSPALTDDAHLLGREGELEALLRFLGFDDGPQTLVLSGEAGIGKSTLFEAAVGTATSSLTRILAARAAEAEAALPFTTLADLFDGVDFDSCDELPEPQRRALDVALVRREAGSAPPATRAIALGTLNVVRSLSREGQVLIAVDDVPWVDSQSGNALAFAARRLTGEPVRFLLTRRPGAATPFEAAVERDAMRPLAVEGLSLGAIRRLLTMRLGLTLSRRVARQVLNATLGNPLFALEIGRRLVETGPPPIREALPLPESLEELLGADASAPARRALQAVALGGLLTVSELEVVVGAGALEAGMAERLVVAFGDRVRPAHPLLASAVLERTSMHDQRRLLSSLARAVQEPSRRSWFLARATTHQDAGLAAAVEEGASVAFARGATEQAMELAEHALRLTPTGAPERAERILALGECLLRADESVRLRTLLERELSSFAPGDARARGHLLLSSVVDDQQEYERQLELAIATSADSPGVHARALCWQALDAAVSFLERLDEAEAKIGMAERLAAEGADAAFVRYAAAWIAVLRGRAPTIDGVAVEADGSPWLVRHSVERVAAIRLAFRGLVEEARGRCTCLFDVAQERGDERSAEALRHQLGELELRVGRVRAAQRSRRRDESG